MGIGISLIQPLASGTALRLFVTPPPRADYWRVLRRTADVFTGPDDAGAVLIADVSDYNMLLDTVGLENGVLYHYRAYFRVAGAWVASPTVSATPAATYQGDTCDVVGILQARLAQGLAVEVLRGAVVPEQGDGVPVVMAPMMLAEHVRFPMVHLHLDSFAPAEHALGMDVSGIGGDADDWGGTEGFRARSTVSVVGVARSADERNALRLALIRVLQSNYPVFAYSGMDLVEFSFTDSEQLEDKAADLFLTVGSFTCQHASFVTTGRLPAIGGVETTPSYYGMEPPPNG